MSTRQQSLRARLAVAGLDPQRALSALERADLATVEGQLTAPAIPIIDGLLAQVSEAVEPDDALQCICELRINHAPLFDQVCANQEWQARVVAVAGASRPLGALLAQYPDAVEALRTLEHVVAARIADRVRAAVLAVTDTAEQASAIAAIRRAATADIAARDLTAALPVEQVAAELAELAEGVLTGTLDAVHAQYVADGVPTVRIAVIGMGKLGGHELNYVSDVDVIFVHEPTNDAPDDQAANEARAVLTRLLDLLNASTTMGRAYEVDPTLRPEGTSGPLSRTVAAFEAYWERWAKTWEFQAMLKARPVAGDRALGRTLLERAEPYVWPDALDPDVVAEIREMKSRIEAKPEVRRHGTRQIKLGPGGIRDIEFAVQLLQLVHGRGDRSLRHTGTLATLAALAAGGYVDPEDAEPFADAYRLLRTVEHRLQLAHERRTHTIPEDEDRQEWLARSLGYRVTDEADARSQLLRDLTRIQREVRELHAKLFYRPLLETYAEVSAAAAELTVPRQVTAIGDAAAIERLHALGFQDGRAALRDLRRLTAGLSRRARTVRAVLPAMLQVLQDTPRPDAGLAQFRDLIEAQNQSSQLLAYLRDHPAAVDLLGRVIGTSQVAGELLIGQPKGVEWLSDESLRDHPRTRDELERMALARMRWQDPTAALRRFKRLELLRLVLRDLDGDTTVSGVGEELAALADACLVGALHAEIRRQAVERGIDDPDDPDALGVRMAIIGMGKLAGRELQYASDLDVVVVHEVLDGVDEQYGTELALQIAANIKQSLSAITSEGAAFDVDLDLRPEGKSGPLSRSLVSYEQYWQRWAEPWEHQALLRVRYVAGSVDLGKRFVAAARLMAYPESPEPNIAAMRRMKARLEKERIPRRVAPERHLKLGPGGLSDIEWTVQLLQQQCGLQQPIVQSASTMEALDALQDAELITHRDAQWLRDGYHFVSQLRNRLYLIRHRDVDVLPSSREVIEVVARSLGYPRGGWQQFEDDWRRHARHVRQVCERVFYGMDGSQQW